MIELGPSFFFLVSYPFVCLIRPDEDNWHYLAARFSLGMHVSGGYYQTTPEGMKASLAWLCNQ